MSITVPMTITSNSTILFRGQGPALGVAERAILNVGLSGSLCSRPVVSNQWGSYGTQEVISQPVLSSRPRSRQRRGGGAWRDRRWSQAVRPACRLPKDKLGHGVVSSSSRPPGFPPEAVIHLRSFRQRHGYRSAVLNRSNTCILGAIRCGHEMFQHPR